MVRDVQPCKYTKTYWIMYFKKENFILAELFLSKVLIKKKKKVPWYFVLE